MSLVLGRLAWLAIVSGVSIAAAQQASITVGGELPSAPAVVSTQPASAAISINTEAAVSGTVMDANGAEVQNAHVELRSLSGAIVRSGQSGDEGEFTFTGLPAGVFKVVVSGSGWGTYTSPPIQLQAGAFRMVPKIVLPLTSSTVVRVTADREQLAEEQVQIATQQRVLRVFPNFYSTYDWNAPPMQARQKFQLTLRALSDPMEFAGVAATAGIEQKDNVFPSYGTGAEGYGKRFGAAYANDFSAEILAYAAFPSLFHQDPRYFYKGTGSAGSRALYALSSAIIARGDNGRRQPNYSYILGSFTAGAISNLYYPASDRGAALTFYNGLADIGMHAGAGLVREFILKGITTRVHGKAH